MLPRGAKAKARRLVVGWRGRPITALSQGPFRAYLYPLFTPDGVAVTAESPIDHPHHQSVSIGTDHFVCLLPYSADKLEEATYQFYINETFQGRAPGRILGVSVEYTELADDHLRIVQELQWQGPEEWGAPERRAVAEETRTIDFYPGEVANLIDVRSQLRPTEWDIRIGPTRHAYFTVRLTEELRVLDGGRFTDSEGRTEAASIQGQTADWVDCSGPVGHGRRAGIALFPHTSARRLPWHVADYGTITVNPFQAKTVAVNRGDAFDVALRIAAHDGDAAEASVAELFDSFKQQIEV